MVLALLLARTAPADAQQDRASASDAKVEACKRMADKAAQLDCLRPLVGVPDPGSQASAKLGPLAEDLREASKDAAKRRPGGLVDHWWLNEKSNIGIGQLTPHRPVYVIVRKTDDVNEQPSRTPAPVDYDKEELKFQLSFRSEIVSPEQFAKFSSSRLRLWLGFTQQANWQVFDADASRPFRETNYEPEGILTIDTRAHREDDAPVSALPALVNLGLVHQSNGRSNPESRTWWRAYVQGGWQIPGGSLLARIWHTINEGGMRLDNADINDHVGRGDLVFRTAGDSLGHFSVLLRNNFRRVNRGFYQVDWRSRGRVLIAPLHVQISTGYGESLLDYNHKQETLGVGFSFWDW